MLVVFIMLLTKRIFVSFSLQINKSILILQVGTCKLDTYEKVTIIVYKLIADAIFLKKIFGSAMNPNRRFSRRFSLNLNPNWKEMKVKDYHIILASNSPRRKELLVGLDVAFEVRVIPGLEEHYPASLPAEERAFCLPAGFRRRGNAGTFQYCKTLSRKRDGKIMAEKHGLCHR